ncbi:putative gem-associated protein 6-like [Penaeus vannamei]|uniref:Putative gem-associated protein 6-like n=1 Tax=Penaeus vannamei TaxID=6689 RepID=A0A423TTG0_PENVA|nr:putative gem-associated protein 6-like [Penaeus vannamei]
MRGRHVSMYVLQSGHDFFSNFFTEIFMSRTRESERSERREMSGEHTSVILVEFGENGSTEVIIVSGYNVKNITVQDDKPSPSLVSAIDNLFRKEQIHYSSQELTARRESLCVWLAENRVPYTVRDDMSVEVLQTAVIAQPYEPGSVQCTNEVVLDKVMKLVQQMPVQAATTT